MEHEAKAEEGAAEVAAGSSSWPRRPRAVSNSTSIAFLAERPLLPERALATSARGTSGDGAARCSWPPVASHACMELKRNEAVLTASAARRRLRKVKEVGCRADLLAAGRPPPRRQTKRGGGSRAAKLKSEAKFVLGSFETARPTYSLKISTQDRTHARTNHETNTLLLYFYFIRAYPANAITLGPYTLRVGVHVTKLPLRRIWTVPPASHSPLPTYTPSRAHATPPSVRVPRGPV